jgi:hypothetical protein
MHILTPNLHPPPSLSLSLSPLCPFIIHVMLLQLQISMFVNKWFPALFYFYFQAKRMDVVWGETAGVDGQLWLLCPILFILQVIYTKSWSLIFKNLLKHVSSIIHLKMNITYCIDLFFTTLYVLHNMQ